MKLNFINAITIISIFQSVFLSISFLIRKDKNRTSNSILSAILLVFSFQIIFSLSINYWSYFAFLRHYKFFYLLYQTAYLISPLIYLYIKSITYPNYKFSVKELIHFLPFIIITTLISVILFVFDIHLFFNYTRFGITIHSIFYIVILLIYLKSKNIKFIALYRLNSSEDFIKILLVSYIILWIINVQIFAVIKLMIFASWCAYVSSIYALSLFIFINFIYLLAVARPNVFVLKRTNTRTLLSFKKKNSVYKELTDYIKKEKPYLEYGLTIKQLSEELHIPVREISLVINEKHNTNFNDFMNIYRIEESKKYLDDNKSKLTIQEIFYNSGFSSKSTFNLVFKKHTGITPLEYRKRHQT